MDGIERTTMETHLDSAEIGAIVAIGAIIVVFIYWRIRRSRKGKNED
jgi:hypothetical protein